MWLLVKKYFPERDLKRRWWTMPAKITVTKTETPGIRLAVSFAPAIKYGFDPVVPVLIIAALVPVSGIRAAPVSGTRAVPVSDTVNVRALATRAVVEAGADVDALRFIK
jgi:hypothetical protein